jgi:hypothetical protein
MKRLLFASIFALSTAACGGSKQEAKDPSLTQADLTPMQQLEAIPTELDAEAKAMTKPIDDAEGAINDLTSLPKKHKIDAGQLMSMARATMDGGRVDVKLDGNVSAEAKAEVEAALKRLGEVTAGLKAVPARAAALTKRCVEATAKLPVLATKISTEASVKAANPFAGAETKAKAQAEMQSVQKVQADVNAKINEVQAKVTGIPALATTALAKMGTSFAAR